MLEGMGIPDMETIQRWASLIRDVGLVVGVPTLIVIGVKLYSMVMEALKARSDALEAQNNFLRETQFDRAAALLEGQKKVYELEREGLQRQLDEFKLDKSRQEGSVSEEKLQQLKTLAGKKMAELAARIQAFDTSRAFLLGVDPAPPGRGWYNVPSYKDQTKIVSPKGLFFSGDGGKTVVFNDQTFAIYFAGPDTIMMGMSLISSPAYVSPPNGIGKISFSDDSKTIIVTGTDNKEIRYALDGKQIKE